MVAQQIIHCVKDKRDNLLHSMEAVCGNDFFLAQEVERSDVHRRFKDHTSEPGFRKGSLMSPDYMYSVGILFLP